MDIYLVDPITLIPNFYTFKGKSKQKGVFNFVEPSQYLVIRSQ